jgi:hypothetical protein
MLITPSETVAPQKRANGLPVYTTLIVPVATCKNEKVINKYEYR